LARESKIPRLLELEADVEKLSRANSHWIAQIRKPRHEVPKNSQGREQAVRPAKPDDNLLDFGALENEKELPLRRMLK
jgi:hypothetical protein